MIKLTLLYGYPEDPLEFERYYADSHLPLAEKMPGVYRLELTRLGPGIAGSPPEYYRMAELSFADEAQMGATFASAEGQAALADLPNFATGGVTTLKGFVEN